MLGHVASCGQVKRVVAPALGDSVRGHHAPPFVRPLGVAVWVAVELHPLGGEVPEEGDVSGLGVHPSGGQLGALHGYVDALHPAHLLHPGEGVFGVEDEDETGAVAGVLLLPQLQQVAKVEALTSCRIEDGERKINTIPLFCRL